MAKAKKKNDLFGDNILVSGDSIIDKERKVISVGPAHNMIMGGVQEGTFGVVTGPPKVGKTVFCLHVAAQAQREENNYKCPKSGKSIPRKVFFSNIEGRLNGRDMAGIQGLITTEDRFQVISSNLDRLLHAGEHLEIVESLIKEHPGSIFIIDSFSQLCSESRMQEDIRNRHRDDVPLMLAAFCKRICNVVPITNSIVMGITHLIANQGPGMSAWSEASGRKIQYATDWKLKALYKQYYPKNAEKPTGQTIHWQCETSNLGPPGMKCESLLRYGVGIDVCYDLALLCIDVGIINKGGAWYSIPMGLKPDVKLQGLDKLSNHIRETDGLYEKLLKEFKELTGDS